MQLGEPQSFKMNHLDVMTFPDLYPNGHYGMDWKRDIPLSRVKFLHNRMKTKDRRFMQPDYMFFLVNQSDMMQINASIVFQLKKRLPHDISLKQALLEKNPEVDEWFTSFFASVLCIFCEVHYATKSLIH